MVIDHKKKNARKVAWGPARPAEGEKEYSRPGDELAQRRQAPPWVPVQKEYRFETDDGIASLAELFQGRSALLVYHFMFGPDWRLAALRAR